MTAAAVQAMTAVAQNAVIAVKVRLKELLEHSFLVHHFSDDQGDSDYYQRKESSQEMEERGQVADNDVQQQEN